MVGAQCIGVPENTMHAEALFSKGELPPSGLKRKQMKPLPQAWPEPKHY